MTVNTMGAMPYFFALLHEVGHHVLHRNGAEDRLTAEFEADAFAAEILHANGFASALGLPFLHLFSTGSHSEAIERRLATLAANDRSAVNLMPELPYDYRVRIDELGQYYATTFASACNG